MHRSFGMETRNTSTRWDEVRQGPSREDVLAHTRKLGLYNTLIRQSTRRLIGEPQSKDGHVPEASSNATRDSWETSSFTISLSLSSTTPALDQWAMAGTNSITTYSGNIFGRQRFVELKTSGGRPRE